MGKRSSRKLAELVLFYPGFFIQRKFGRHYSAVDTLRILM